MTVHGIFMSFDEFFFHRRRTLRKWERWGHPVDTGFFAVCVAWLWLAPATEQTLYVYVILSVVSSMVIVKDEREHLLLCEPMEQFLHALLFVLHPVILGTLGVLKWLSPNDSQLILPSFLLMVIGFGFYQVIYWNWWRRD